MAAWDGQTLESQGPDVVAMFGGDAGKWEAEHNAELQRAGWTGPGQPPGSGGGNSGGAIPPGYVRTGDGRLVQGTNTPGGNPVSGGGAPPPGASGQPPGASGQPPGGGEVSMTLEQLKLQYAQQAAYQAYLNAKLKGDNEQVAINKATAEANAAYQRAQIEQQEKQRLSSGTLGMLGVMTQRAQAYNQAQEGFERTGVATGGRIAGISALGKSLSPSTFAAALGLPEDDPRVKSISAAASQLAPAGNQSVSSQVSTGGAAPQPGATTQASPAEPPSTFGTFGQPSAAIPPFVRNYQSPQGSGGQNGLGV